MPLWNDPLPNHRMNRDLKIRGHAGQEQKCGERGAVSFRASSYCKSKEFGNQEHAAYSHIGGTVVDVAMAEARRDMLSVMS